MATEKAEDLRVLQLPEDLSLGRKRKDPPSEAEADAPSTKRLSGDDTVSAAVAEQPVISVAEPATPGVFETLEGFTVKAVLSNSADYKRIVVEGLVGNQTAVVILDKKPFTEDGLTELFGKESKLKSTFKNDIYGSYDCFPSAKTSALKTTIVFPATQKHVDKYRHQPLYLVDETPEIYAKVTLPFLESSSFDIQWVFNILERKKESERIVFEDKDPANGFILLPDLKWDGVALENLYLVGIVHKKGIRSVRELTGDHLPLLENILENGTKAIKDKYGLGRSQLRIYVHYQPSYYHFHVHFTALSFNAPGIYAEKSHLIQTIIANLKANPNYYKEAVLPFVVKKNEKLYTSLVEHGYDF